MSGRHYPVGYGGGGSGRRSSPRLGTGTTPAAGFDLATGGGDTIQITTAIPHLTFDFFGRLHNEMRRALGICPWHVF